MGRTESEVPTAVSKYIRVVQDVVPVERAILYGSYAKGNPHETSDIDLAIISPAFGKDFLRESQLLYRLIINSGADPAIEPRPIGTDEVTDTGEMHFFVKEILDSGRVVYDQATLPK